MPRIANVMVVDDFDDDLALFTRSLVTAGISRECIETFGTVPHAIEYLESLDIAKKPKPDLIFIDFRMPDVPGIQFLRWLRDRPKFAAVPRVVLSLGAAQFDVDRAYAAGANCFFDKPADLTKTLHLFRLILEFWNNSHMPSF